MNLREIKDLINLMNEHALGEIEIESEGTKIKLKKSNGEMVVERMVSAASHAPAARAAEAAAVAAAAVTAEKAAAAAKNTAMIKSPMVGTYYSAPAPDAELYVKVGSKVEIGQVVCIIEAMKLMNEIKSEVKGVISEIHISNGDPVEFGQPLFSVQ